MKAFSMAATPQLIFGAGKIDTLSTVLKPFGKRVLLVTGAHSFMATVQGQALPDLLKAAGISLTHHTIDKEPTPAMIDTIVSNAGPAGSDVVVAIGGGSVLDAGKAIAAMMPLREGVKDYLEGVGTRAHPGTKLPFIAIPTTAGTGSEATKNAVLTEIGERGYKKSLRHNNFIPDIALIDPALTISCPQATTAASGMDAFTQLLESYLSTAATPLTDALALEGLKHIAQSLVPAWQDGNNLQARSGMALAAYLSGITLANAGLGLVHGFASAVGGYHDISHGVICSALMPAANRLTVKKLRAQYNEAALARYTTAGRLLAGDSNKPNEYYVDFLLDTLDTWVSTFNIPTLSQGGVTPADIEKILDASDNKNNPVILEREEMAEVLELAMHRRLR